MNTLIDLIRFASEGRGLWAGLFPADPPALLELPSGAHVTIAHFGRYDSAARAERAVHAADRACTTAMLGTCGPIRARSWAVGRMDQSKSAVVALLLEGDQNQFTGDDNLVSFAHRVHRAAADAGMPPDRRYQFHPHLTLRALAPTDRAEIPRHARVELVFPKLSLVCGDARVDFEPGPLPF